MKRYRQAVLKAAFEGKLTEEWRKAHKGQLELASALLERIKEERKKALGKKYKELPPLDMSELPKLPDEWCWTLLETILIDARYGTSKKCSQEKIGLAVLRIPNIVEGEIDYANLKFTDLSKSEESTLSLKPGDILVIRTNGSLELVGRTAIFRGQHRIYAFASYLIRIRTAYPAQLGSFVNRYFLSKWVRNFIERNARTTAGQYNINLNILGSIPIPLPSAEEQQQIYSEIDRDFSVADEIEKIVEQTLTQSQRLRQTILKTAFEGKLVPQDPNDEQAEKLLERIKQEKAKNQQKLIKEKRRDNGRQS